MKVYRLLRKNKTFKSLPPEIQTNQEAILWAAIELGIALPSRGKIDDKRLERNFKQNGGLALTCDDIAFFPHGKVLVIEAPKHHALHARDLRKKDSTLKAPRAKQRKFVNSSAFVGEPAIATAAA